MRQFKIAKVQAKVQSTRDFSLVICFVDEILFSGIQTENLKLLTDIFSMSKNII